MTFTGVEPYLYYSDAAAALAWLQRVFGFGPATVWKQTDDRVDESEIAVGPAKISICGRAAAPGEGTGLLLIVHTDDVDGLYQRVRGALADSIDPPREEAYGPRTFHVTDPWGYRWYFWQGEAVAG